MAASPSTRAIFGMELPSPTPACLSLLTTVLDECRVGAVDHLDLDLAEADDRLVQDGRRDIVIVDLTDGHAAPIGHVELPPVRLNVRDLLERARSRPGGDEVDRAGRWRAALPGEAVLLVARRSHRCGSRAASRSTRRRIESEG